MNASRVSSINPTVVDASGSETVLFFKSRIGLKNKMKKAPTKSMVMMI
jgi:hypothetical protein